MVKFGSILISFFLFSLLPENSLGKENYAVKNYTTDQGLPHNHVREIVQDQNGFLWIATWDGLSRYDGYEFRNYYHNPQDTTSLLYFTAEQVLVDCANQVWVMSATTGVSLYDRKNDRFIRYVENEQSTDITLDQEKKLWYLSGHKIKRWDYQKRQFVLVDVEIDLPGAEIVTYVSLEFDNRGGMWLECQKLNGELYSLYCNDSSVRPLRFKFLGNLPDSFMRPVPSNGRFSRFPLVSESGNFWVNNNYKLYKLDLIDRSFKVSNDVIPESEFRGISDQYRADFLQKIEFYNKDLKLTEEKSDSSFVFVESFCEDRQKTHWLSIVVNGRDALGLTRAIPNPNWFRHYFTDFRNNGRLNAIFPVLKDRFGTLWAGPQNTSGLFRMESNGKCYEENKISQKLKEDVRGPRVFFEDKTGIWIGYYNNLLVYYDFAQQKYSTIFYKETGLDDPALPNNFIHIVRDGEDLIVFDYLGAYRFRPGSGICKQIYVSENPYAIYSVLHEGNGDWWLGFGHERLRHFDKDFQLIKEYKIGNGMFNLEGICAGDDNDLWLSTLGGGLVHFNRTTGKAEILTTADGLSNNTCYGILKDKKGNLWISTNHGISRFNPKTSHFRTFGPSAGLKIDEFNSDATYQAPDGELFFGGMGGVVSFYPDSIIDDQKNEAQPLVIEDFRVSGANRYFKKAIYECDTVILNKGDDNFEASFACLDFRNADKIKYRYRLSGEDKEFVETDHRHRSVNYSSLLPGEYLFEIEATNRDGDWVSKRSLAVIVPAFYYQTAWFRLLVAFLVILLIFYLIYGYIRRIQLIARQQQEELRLESLRGQMNPHFIFNSLNSINYFISQNDRLSANRYIADFSRLIRTILGNTASDYIPLSQELESLHDYLKLEHLRFGDKFDYQVFVSEEIFPEDLMVFPGMVQPFIENAVWHGVRGLEERKGLVKIELMPCATGCLKCVVEDDGVGRKLSEKRKSSMTGKTSRGISIVVERLKIVNHLRRTNFRIDLEDVFPDREETGTRVTIDIPVKA